MIVEYFLNPPVNMSHFVIFLCSGMVWKVKPSKASSCHYRGLIDEVIRESSSNNKVILLCQQSVRRVRDLKEGRQSLDTSKQALGVKVLKPVKGVNWCLGICLHESMLTVAFTLNHLPPD